MKIALLGTRGIPNQYGGFEQFAEVLSTGLVAKGLDVTVYNPHDHNNKDSTWQGVKIIHKYCPPKLSASIGQIVYDLKCIFDCRRRNFDIIYQLGYTSSAIWYWLHPRKAYIITNMDGIEWKRDKYRYFGRIFVKYAEKLAIKRSQLLIADSIGIYNYLRLWHGVKAEYISYGAKIFETPDLAAIEGFHLEPDKYYLCIARFQPENNLEMIIRGYLQSKSNLKLVMVGNGNNLFGRALRRKYRDERIIYLGAIFDKKILDNLRYHSRLYFHGHTAGGTNPSLLEAMGANALICAHENPFNREVLEDNAFYFKTEQDISKLLTSNFEKYSYGKWKTNNSLAIKNQYNWETIIENYYQLFFQKVPKVLRVPKVP